MSVASAEKTDSLVNRILDLEMEIPLTCRFVDVSNTRDLLLFGREE